MKYYLGCILFLFYIAGCTNTQKDVNGRLVDEFPEPIELKGKEILKGEQGILYASLVDSFIICIADRDTFYHVYDKQQRQLASFGQRGRGPGESVIFPLIRDVITEEDTTKLLVDNQITKELLTINMASSIEKREIVVDKTLKIPKKLWGLKSIFHNRNKEFVGVYDDREQKRADGQLRGFYYNPESDNINTFKLFNLEMDPFEVIAEMNLNARSVAVSPDRSKMVTVMSYYPMLEFFSIGSSIPKRYLLDPGPPGHTFSLADYKERNLTDFYQYLQVTDNYIYLLYSGRKKNEPQKEQIIRVMDWDGNPIAQYLIPREYDLSTFDVDEKNKTFYGSSYNNDAIYVLNYE